MSRFDDDLRTELRRRADSLSPATGDLEGVKRAGRRKALASRLGYVGAAVLAGGVAALMIGVWAPPSATSEAFAAQVEEMVLQQGYAVTPHETAALLADCLQDRGLPVVRDGVAITFDNREIAEEEFESALSSCETELKDTGFLLPGDNPEYLEVLFAQYRVLADCYRAAGIAISEAPDMTSFIADRQAGRAAWSPQAEAMASASRAEAEAAEEACHLPTPGEVSSAG